MMAARWKLTERPESMRFKNTNPFVHKKINQFDEMPDDQRKVFRSVKSFIDKLIGETKCYAFGSRVNGNWIESSDYDIFIQAQPSSEIKMILLRKNFGAKIDLRYITGQTTSQMIEIR